MTELAIHNYLGLAYVPLLRMSTLGTFGQTRQRLKRLVVERVEMQVETTGRPDWPMPARDVGLLSAGSATIARSVVY